MEMERWNEDEEATMDARLGRSGAAREKVPD
jgi:hypothetical protein